MKLTREQVIEQYNNGRSDFSGENLSWLNLSDANFSGANMSNCIGNMKEIKSIQLDTYKIVFTKDILAIGCKQYTIYDWETFTDDEIHEMDEEALKWWKKWKDWVFNAIEMSN